MSSVMKLRRFAVTTKPEIPLPSMENDSGSGELDEDYGTASSPDEYVPKSFSSSYDSDLHESKRQPKKKKVKKSSKERTKDFQKLMKKKPPRPCLYCKKFQSKLNRHLTDKHSMEDKVREALKLPRRQMLAKLDLLRKEGIYAYNMEMIKEGKPLICERSSESSGIKICQQCKGFFRRKTFFKHAKTCSRRHDTSKTDGFGVELIEESSCVGFMGILNRFNDDEAGRLCKTDKVIKLVGRSQYSKHKMKPDKQCEVRKSVMTNMRQLANLYLEFIKCSEDKSLGVEKMFDRKHFNALEAAVRRTTSHEDGTLKHGLKLLIGNLIKTAAKRLKGSYMIEDRDDDADSIDKFKAVLDLRWADIFADAEYQAVRNRNENLRQPVKLPNEENIKKLRDYAVTHLTNLTQDYAVPCVDLYITLRDLVVSRLTLFNARRGGEPSRLTVNDWLNAKNDKWVDRQRVNSASESEQILLKNLKVIYQGGKGVKHLVPVLVPPDCIKALDFLQSPEIRLECLISPQNSFLFPSTRGSLDHASGWHSLKSVAVAAGLEFNITATTMRHRASTLYASLDVPEEQRQAFFSHMGHSASMNKDVYQCPLGIREITQVGGYFASIDGLQLAGTKGATNNTVVTDQMSDFSVSQASTSSADMQHMSDTPLIAEAAVPDEARHKWTSEETSVIRARFANVINQDGDGNQGSLPGYKELGSFVESSGLLKEIADERTRLNLVKTKIFNERKKSRSTVNKRLAVLQS